MSTPEGLLTRRILDYLRGAGAYAVKYHGSAFGRVGVPDVLACVQGTFFAIEVKAPRGSTTPRQEEEIRRIRKAGGVAFVARCVEDVARWVDSVQLDYDENAMRNTSLLEAKQEVKRLRAEVTDLREARDYATRLTESEDLNWRTLKQDARLGANFRRFVAAEGVAGLHWTDGNGEYHEVTLPDGYLDERMAEVAGGSK